MLAAARKKKGVVRLLLDAGANPLLTDSNGRDALYLAAEAGCSETVACLFDALERIKPGIIDNVEMTKEGKPHVVKANTLDEESTLKSVTKPWGNSQSIEATITRHIDTSLAIWSSPPDMNETTESVTPVLIEKVKAPNATIIELDVEPFNPDFESEWEAEVEPISPEGDDSVVETVCQINKTIDRHRAIDRYEDWGDVDLYLPERSTSFERNEDDRAIFQLLLSALREGMVLEDTLAKVCTDADGIPNEQDMRLMTMVAGELGATIVDWSGGEEPLPEEPSYEEERLLDEAMIFAKDLASGRNEPFRYYSKDIRGDLLEADEESALGREMEEAGLAALAALAQWPEGLTLLFDAANQLVLGEADAEEFSAGPEPSSEDIPSPRGDIPEDEDSELEEVASFLVAAVGAIKTARGDTLRITKALVDARLTRGFLLKLATQAGQNEAGLNFSEALGRQSAARERMILCNLRLSLSIAKKHLWSRFPIDDLVQEANIGLIKAVERYDWRKGFRFSTYATWWIRQQVTRFIADHVRTIRIPVHMNDSINRLNRITQLLLQEMGREPTDVELGERMGISADKIRNIQAIHKVTIISMETPMGNDASSFLGDFIEDTNMPSPIDVAVLTGLKKVTQEALAGLTPREAKVLRMRFGIDVDTDHTLEEIGKKFDLTRERIRQIEAKVLRMRFGIDVDTDHTLEEIGKKFDLTRERIRQIEAKALKKLRYPERSDKLRSFLE